MRKIAGMKTSIVVAAIAIFWIGSTWVPVPGWSDPVNKGGRFPHAIQVFWTAIGVLALWGAVVIYRRSDDEDGR